VDVTFSRGFKASCSFVYIFHQSCDFWSRDISTCHIDSEAERLRTKKSDEGQNVYLKKRQINERAECTHFSLAAAAGLLAKA
jgi:hypothetical protein